MPKFSIIVAHAENMVIGKNNSLPWRISADLQYFKKVTMGKPLLMGRKTYDSIGKPLPGRRMLILSREKNLEINGCEVISSIEQLDKLFPDNTEIMVAGGAEIYKQMLAKANKFYLTLVKAKPTGDAFFPAYNLNEWHEIYNETHDMDTKNQYDYEFKLLDRRV